MKSVKSRLKSQHLIMRKKASKFDFCHIILTISLIIDMTVLNIKDIKDPFSQNVFYHMYDDFL